MNFDFSDDQKVLRDQARKFLTQHAAPARVRKILESDALYDRDLWKGMAEQGWPGTAVPETYGGAGFGYLEMCVIAEEAALSPKSVATTARDGRLFGTKTPVADGDIADIAVVLGRAGDTMSLF